MFIRVANFGVPPAVQLCTLLKLLIARFSSVDSNAGKTPPTTGPQVSRLGYDRYYVTS
jgi:hypothetical protein